MRAGEKGDRSEFQHTKRHFKSITAVSPYIVHSPTKEGKRRRRYLLYRKAADMCVFAPSVVYGRPENM
jgi:hypothetical protein